MVKGPVLAEPFAGIGIWVFQSVPEPELTPVQAKPETSMVLELVDQSKVALCPLKTAAGLAVREILQLVGGKTSTCLLA